MPFDTEPVVRLSIFMVVFAALALWERWAPARTLSLPRSVRWQANLGLALVNMVVVRLIVPGYPGQNMVKQIDTITISARREPFAPNLRPA